MDILASVAQLLDRRETQLPESVLRSDYVKTCYRTTRSLIASP